MYEKLTRLIVRLCCEVDIGTGCCQILRIGAECKLLVLDSASEQLEGEGAGQQTVVLEFESKEKAMEIYNSGDYQAVLPKRLGATSGVTFKPDDLVMYDDAINAVFSAEMDIVRERMVELDAAPAAELAQHAVDLAHRLMMHLHRAKIRRFFSTMNLNDPRNEGG